jgi:hypothetical protein
MPVIVVLLGSGVGTCSAAIAFVLEAGVVLSLGIWFAGGFAGLVAAMRAGA